MVAQSYVVCRLVADGPPLAVRRFVRAVSEPRGTAPGLLAWGVLGVQPLDPARVAGAQPDGPIVPLPSRLASLAPVPARRWLLQARTEAPVAQLRTASEQHPEVHFALDWWCPRRQAAGTKIAVAGEITDVESVPPSDQERWALEHELAAPIDAPHLALPERAPLDPALLGELAGLLGAALGAPVDVDDAEEMFARRLGRRIWAELAAEVGDAFREGLEYVDLVRLFTTFGRLRLAALAPEVPPGSQRLAAMLSGWRPVDVRRFRAWRVVPV